MTEAGACRVCPVRLVEDAGRLFGASLSEVVPPEAQTHLLNAQRELLLALALTIEHNTSRSPARPRGAKKRGPARSRRRPSRVELD